MRFSYLFLADAANRSPDGKLNALGIGARILTVREFPSQLPVVVLGAVDASVDEAGSYDLVVEITEPDGTVVPLVHARATVDSEVTDPRVPTGISFMLGLSHPFTREGIYTIVARVADCETHYEFVVRRDSSSSELQSETGGATRPAKRRRSKSL